MRRHLLRPDAHREERDPPVWSRSPWCAHGGSRPCAWPGCPAGVKGEQLVVAGPREVVYLARARQLDVMDGRLLDLGWAWVEVRRQTLQAAGEPRRVTA